MDMKRCTKCGEEKPFEDFYKHKAWRDGRHPWCKVCHLAAARARRAANLELHRERDKQRYANNPARRAQQIKTARAFYAANREEQRANRKAYYEANRELFAMWTAKRKARKRNAEHQPYTRREIYDRDNGTCMICRTALPYEPNAFHLDHIVPLTLGGADTPANIQLTCPPCNREKWMHLEGQIHFAV